MTSLPYSSKRARTYPGLPNCGHRRSRLGYFLSSRSSLFCFLWGFIWNLIILTLLFQPYLFLAPFSPINKEWQQIAADRAEADVALWEESDVGFPIGIVGLGVKLSASAPNWWVSDWQGRNSDLLYSGQYLLRLSAAATDIIIRTAEYRNSLMNSGIDDLEVAELIRAEIPRIAADVVEQEGLYVEWTPYTKIRYYAFQSFLGALTSAPEDNSSATDILNDEIKLVGYRVALVAIASKVLAFFIFMKMPSVWSYRVINWLWIRRSQKHVAWVI